MLHPARRASRAFALRLMTPTLEVAPPKHFRNPCQPMPHSVRTSPPSRTEATEIVRIPPDEAIRIDCNRASSSQR